jgi:hypothetical protein
MPEDRLYASTLRNQLNGGNQGDPSIAAVSTSGPVVTSPVGYA